jgi:hypothetical protein
MMNNQTIFWCLLAVCAARADSCRSGLEPGQKPGPYSAVICTGPERGQSYCYICETADKPAVVVFARNLNDCLANFVQRLDQAIADHKKADLRAWVTVLGADQSTLDAEVVAWVQQHRIRSIPIGVFESTDGPPSYRLAADAEVTVLFFVKQKVVANFGYRAREMTDEQIERMMKMVPKIVGER